MQNTSKAKEPGNYSVRSTVLYFSGCVPQNRLNGIDLDDKETEGVNIDRQNVAFACPCETGDCANNGTCVVENSTTLVANTTTSWKVCKCKGEWEGPRCQKKDERGQGESKYSLLTNLRMPIYSVVKHSPPTILPHPTLSCAP